MEGEPIAGELHTGGGIRVRLVLIADSRRNDFAKERAGALIDYVSCWQHSEGREGLHCCGVGVWRVRREAGDISEPDSHGQDEGEDGWSS